jgi:hypothetical protein
LNYVRIIVAVFSGILIYRLATTESWQEGLSDAAIGLLKPVLVPLVELINKPFFVYATSVLIVLSAIIACLIYWKRVVRPRARRFRDLRGAIDGLPIPDSWDSELCSSAMHRAGDALRQAGLFLSAWAIFQSQRQRDGMIPAAPFSYFAASDPSIEEDKSGGFMQSLPGYFISVGLIFTFIGLVVALYFAGRGFRSGNLEEARTSILQLFNASSFKFLTSVAALFSSLLISVIFRYSASLLRHETETTVTRIERFIGPWRELEPVRASQPGFGDLAHGLAMLMAKMDALSTRLAAFVDRIDRGASQVQRDAAE